MSRESNFLIGSGERLISKKPIQRSGGQKNQPYSFEEAKERLALQLEHTIASIDELPLEAKPNDEAIISITLHPRYVSKSDHPDKFFESRNLEAVGSKPKLIKPDNWGTPSAPDSESLTDVYYIKSTTSNLKNFLYSIDELPENELNKTICYFENIDIDTSTEKLQGNINELYSLDKILMECVIHEGVSQKVINDFFSYLLTLDENIIYKSEKVRSVGQLGFVPIITNKQNIEAIGKFSFLRAFRRMPELRPFRPSITRSLLNQHLTLPDEVLFDNIKAVIFDGGLPQDLALPDYIKYEEVKGIGSATDELVQHGLAVTSAYLFGSIENTEDLQPISNVTHVRVLGEKHTNPSTLDDLDLYDVMDSMVDYMERESPDLVNISLGPDSSVDDNEVTYWTSKIDSYVANNDVLITVAAGNNGNDSDIAGLNRVQVPSDGVNIISVGASNKMDESWERASYSAVGPGRNPGVVKPDILAFGGDIDNYFKVLDIYNGNFVLNNQCGTSFAAPLVMRHAAFVKGSLGSKVTNMAVRAILIHHADKKDFSHTDVGWGKCNDDLTYAITCDDNEVTVIYQDELAVGLFTRLPLPIQNIDFEGIVAIKSTIVSRTDIDPDYAAAYTKHGFEVAFRPNEDSFKDGGEYPITKPFFPKDKISKDSEHILKAKGAKWECVRKDENRHMAKTILNPVFDLTSHHRSQGRDEKNKQPIKFVCIVTIKCEKSLNLYNEVVKNNRGVLDVLKPQHTIQIKT